jgi:hypothetical protein
MKLPEIWIELTYEYNEVGEKIIYLDQLYEWVSEVLRKPENAVVELERLIKYLSEE